MAAGKAHMEHYNQVADICSDSSCKQPSSTSATVGPGSLFYQVEMRTLSTWSVRGSRRTGLPPPDVQEHLNQVCTGNIQLKVGHTSKSGE